MMEEELPRRYSHPPHAQKTHERRIRGQETLRDSPFEQNAQEEPFSHRPSHEAEGMESDLQKSANQYNTLPHSKGDIIEQRREQRKAKRNEFLARENKKRAGQIVGGLYSGAASPYGRKKQPTPTLLEWMFGGSLFGSGIGAKHTNTVGGSLGVKPGLPVKVPAMSPVELQTAQRRRIQKWQEKGVFYNYSQPAVPSSTTLSNAPEVQRPDESLVVLVLSSRGNQQHRQAIRETWGRNHSVIFVIGGKQPNETEADADIQLEQEAARNRDILDSVHPESYMSLPYKLHFGYRWIIQNMKHVQWILKADDDMVVRVGTFGPALLDMYNAETPLVLGRIIPHSVVQRKGKWADFQYEKLVYPYWPQGSRGHVVSRPVATYLAMQDNLTYYPGEDTSLGIWLDESPLDVRWIHSHYFQNHGQCQEEEWLAIGHKLSPQDIRSCFERIDEWDAESLDDYARKFVYTETREQRKALKLQAQQAKWAPGQPLADEFQRPSRSGNQQAGFAR